MIFNIIMFVCCYPVILIMYFVMKSAGNRNGYCFGSFLKPELREDAAIKEIDANFRRTMKIGTIVWSMVPILTLLIPYFSISFTIWMIWILAACFVPALWFAQAHKRVVEIKKERGWQSSGSTSYADLKSAAEASRVKHKDFVIPLLISVIPGIFLTIRAFDSEYEKMMAIVGWTFALCGLLFYVCAIWTDRQKIGVICEDSTTNLNFARAKKQVWRNCWLGCIWVNTLYTWTIFLGILKTEWFSWVLILGAIVYGVVIIGFAVVMMKKLYDINHTYAPMRTVVDVSEDDEHWIWGIMYYNKNDKTLLVENRLGTGTSMNMAKPFGKATFVFSGIALLIIPVMCIWLILMEFTPIQTTLEDGMIVCEQLFTEYEIAVDEIEECELVTELPDMVKVNGTAMDNLLIGRFEVYREGVYELFANPQNEVFLKLVTDEKQYFISCAEDEDTKAIFDSLEK